MMNPFEVFIKSLSNFDAIKSEIRLEVTDRTLFVTKWNWDFNQALQFQKLAQQFVQKNRHLKVYIFCNHPHCFTMGRGNERGVEGLESFDPCSGPQLSYPLHHIHRGGGLTFHHTGQWIFYPIVALGPEKTLSDLMSWMLTSVRDVIRDEYNISNVITANKLMGVWHQRSKLASIGVGVNRFVTEHGLALNILRDEKMFSEIQKVSPCGISPTTYMALEELLPSHQSLSQKNLIESFHHNFIKKIT